MQTIEYFLQGKKLDQRLNEDGLFMSDHLIAVVDGVTMGKWNVWHGDTGGLFSKNVLMTFLEDATRHGEEIVKKREEEEAIRAAMEAAGDIGEEGEAQEAAEDMEDATIADTEEESAADVSEKDE